MNSAELSPNAAQSSEGSAAAVFSQESIQALSMSDGQMVSPNADMGRSPVVSPWHTLSTPSQYASPPQRNIAAMPLVPPAAASVQTYPAGTDPVLLAQFERVAQMPAWDRALALVHRGWSLPHVEEFTGVPWVRLLPAAMDGPLGNAIKAAQQTPKAISDKFGVPMATLVQECQMRGLTLATPRVAGGEVQPESMDIG